ncbi:hypothetical protein BJY52DRAFT_1316846, partial [Lactarius psammicola]
MAQICDQFSPFLFRVNNLGINTTQSPSEQDDVGGEQWLELIRAFGGATDFRVADELATDILCALDPADEGHTNVLPALRQLLERFTVIHRLAISLRPSLPHLQCRFQTAARTQRPPCRQACTSNLYSGQIHLFPGHLRSQHPEVMQNEPIWNTVLTRLRPSISQIYSLVDRHSSLRGPDI